MPNIYLNRISVRLGQPVWRWGGRFPSWAPGRCCLAWQPWRHEKGPFSFIFWCALAMFSHDSSSWKLANIQKRGSLCYWLADKSLCFCGAAYACVRLDEKTCRCHLQTLVRRLMAEGRRSWNGGSRRQASEANVIQKRHREVLWLMPIDYPEQRRLIDSTSLWGPIVPGYLRHHSRITLPVFPLLWGMLKFLYKYIEPLLWCIWMCGKHWSGHVFGMFSVLMA
jgi:hypothetical protein